MNIKDFCSYSRVHLGDGRFVEIQEHNHRDLKTWVHIINQNGLFSGGEWIHWNGHLAELRQLLNAVAYGSVVQFAENGASFRVCKPNETGIQVIAEETGKSYTYSADATVFVLRTTVVSTQATEQATKVPPVQLVAPVSALPVGRFQLLEID